MFSEETEKQKELFEDFQKPPKKLRFFKSDSKLLGNKIFVLQFSGEKAIFLLIGIIILTIATFSAGVERGKRLARRALPVAQPPSPTVGVGYLIQVGTYANKQYAETDTKNIRKMRLPAYMAPSGKYFIVYVGNYDDIKQVQAALSILKKDYTNSIIKVIKK